MDGAGALAMHGAQAVGAGVAAADDDDVLARGTDEALVGDGVALAAPVLEGEVLHGEVNARQLAPGHGQIARVAGAAGQHDGVEVAPQVGHRHGDADVGVRLEDDAFLLHDGEAAFQKPLLHLELGDAVAKEPADAVGALEDDHRVAGAVELLRAGQPGRARAHHGHPLARPDLGRLRRHPARLEGVLDDGHLDGLDGDRIVVDAEHARSLAGRRAEATGPLGKVVGGVQPLDGVVPAVAIDEVVPVGDQVAQRAALVTEGDATVHAAGRLLLKLLAG